MVLWPSLRVLQTLTVSSIGAVLYTAYLHSLSSLHEPSSHQTKRIFPPPPPSVTLTAGFVAGGIQSVVAAPFDALQTRFRTSDILEGKYKTMWHYAGINSVRLVYRAYLLVGR